MDIDIRRVHLPVPALVLNEHLVFLHTIQKAQVSVPEHVRMQTPYPDMPANGLDPAIDILCRHRLAVFVAQ